MNEPTPNDQHLPPPEVPSEFNPYLTVEVMDHPGHNLPPLSKQPGSLAIAMSVLAGVFTAIVVFCLTFFVTCVGMVSSGNGRSFSFEGLIAISTITALVAAILAAWGILKLIGVIRQ